MPSDTDALEMKLRRMLKEKLARGHVEVILSLDRSGPNGVALNRQLIAGYVEAFRAAADEFGVEGEPDLNVVLRMPGAMDSGAEKSGDELETAVMAQVEEALSRLNEMREQEGRSIGTELRARMANLEKAAAGVEIHRSTISAQLLGTPAIAHAGVTRARRWKKNGSCRKLRCWSIAATFRKNWCG